jgi:hypothetical protein
MAPMPPATTRLGSLSDILVGAADRVAQEPPVDTLAGFDVVAQFSHALLNQQVVRSLAYRGLTQLSAYAPWATLPLPASLAALVPSRLRLQLSAVEARLEVRLVYPQLAALHWPIDVTGGDGGSVVASARRTGTRSRAATRASARTRALGRGRTADVGWLVEINLLTERLDAGILARSAAPAGGRPAAGSRPYADAGNLPDLVATDDFPTGDGRAWDRLTLATGRAITGADAVLNVPAGLWRFGMGLDFAETVAAVTSETVAVTEFLSTDGGRNLLAQALAPLRAASGVRLAPDMAPAGALSAAAVQRFGLAPFAVRDLLLVDARGQFSLCLCAELGGAGRGVLRLVQPLLARQDFAYAASQDVLRPALKACWKGATSGVSFVGQAPVDLPVGDDPEVTRPGRAELSIAFIDTLDDVALKVMPEGHRDAIRLLGRQRLQLLNLWDHEGRRITDLGELAEPHEEPLVLPIDLFETGGSSDEINPNFRDLLAKLAAILVFPTIQPSSIRADSISGFCSSARKTLLVRWTLRTWRDDILPPITDSVMERA